MSTNHEATRIIELRDYTLHPGKRDLLIELFDREFVHTQEALGIRVIGQFRDVNRPDHFVWLRGFPSMEGRAAALHAFYGGPVWMGHRAAANATMVDSDNVLLLQPAWLGAADALEKAPPPVSSGAGRIQATVCSLESESALEEWVDLFRREVQPALLGAGVQMLAALKTEFAPNTYPRLPVRESEHVFVWICSFLPPATSSANLSQFTARGRELMTSEPITLLLEPTAGSKLRPAAAGP